MGLLLGIAYIAVMGVASNLIGAALPRRWFDPRRFPFKPWAWERDGRVYRALRVHSWKTRLPDMSRIAPYMVRKAVSMTASPEDVERVARETCVAEVVHVVLMVFSFAVYLLYPRPLGALLAILYGLSNIPFIIIQRYNRPTLVTLAGRLRERKERIERARTDTLGQHR